MEKELKKLVREIKAMNKLKAYEISLKHFSKNSELTEKNAHFVYDGTNSLLDFAYKQELE